MVWVIETGGKFYVVDSRTKPEPTKIAGWLVFHLPGKTWRFSSLREIQGVTAMKGEDLVDLDLYVPVGVNLLVFKVDIRREDF